MIVDQIIDAHVELARTMAWRTFVAGQTSFISSSLRNFSHSWRRFDCQIRGMKRRFSPRIARSMNFFVEISVSSFWMDFPINLNNAVIARRAMFSISWFSAQRALKTQANIFSTSSPLSHSLPVYWTNAIIVPNMPWDLVHHIRWYNESKFSYSIGEFLWKEIFLYKDIHGRQTSTRNIRFQFFN